MASKEQLEFFQDLFDHEVRRYEHLAERAKLYFAVISFFLGAMLFKFDDVAKFFVNSDAPVIGIALNGGVAVVALIYCVMAMQIKTYEAICDPDRVLMNLDESDLVAEVFFDTRIADFAFAAKQNAVENERTAGYLSKSAVLMLTSIVFTAVLFAYALATWRT